MAIYIRRDTWVDAAGNSRTTSVTGSGTLVLVEAQMLLLSNADIALDSEAQLFANPSPSPVNATYPSVSDYARLLFQTTAGTLVQVTIPAPQSSMFLADQFTVDSASVAGLLAALILVGTDLAGNAITSYVGGTRERSQ